MSSLGLFLTVSINYLLNWYQTSDLTQAQTAAFAAWIFGHIFLAFNLRSDREPLIQLGLFSNKSMIAWSLMAFVALIVGTNIPLLQLSLKTASLPPTSWVIIVVVSFVATFWLELRKLHGALKEGRKCAT